MQILLLKIILEAAVQTEDIKYLCAAPGDQQPLEGSEGANQEQNSPNAIAATQVCVSLCSLLKE